MRRLTGPASGSRRGVTGLRVMVVTATVAVAVAVAAVGPALAAARPSLTVNPATGLQGGSQISFTGADFPPGSALLLEECDPGGQAGGYPCTAISDSVFLTGPDGSVHGTATVIAGPVGTGPGGNCPVDHSQAEHGQTCVVALEPAAPPGFAAVAAIGFALSVPSPADPPPPPPPAPTPSSAVPTTAPVDGGRIGAGSAPRGPGAGTDLAAATAPDPGAPTHAPAPRGSRFRWTTWLSAMIGAAACAGGGPIGGGSRRRRLAGRPGQAAEERPDEPGYHRPSGGFAAMVLRAGYKVGPPCLWDVAGASIPGVAAVAILGALRVAGPPPRPATARTPIRSAASGRRPRRAGGGSWWSICSRRC